MAAGAILPASILPLLALLVLLLLLVVVAMLLLLLLLLLVLLVLLVMHTILRRWELHVGTIPMHVLRRMAGALPMPAAAADTTTRHAHLLVVTTRRAGSMRCCAVVLGVPHPMHQVGWWVHPRGARG
jgi:hypothetical protein